MPFTRDLAADELSVFRYLVDVALAQAPRDHHLESDPVGSPLSVIGFDRGPEVSTEAALRGEETLAPPVAWGHFRTTPRDTLTDWMEVRLTSDE